MRTVTVIGCLGSQLPAGAGSALAGATLVAGAERHLSTLDTRAKRLVLGNLDAALRRLSIHDGPAAVLASGDPGFFGIVRALCAAGMEVRVLPAPSSVAVAFARLGLPWDDALVVSAHGRSPRRAVNACRAYPKVAVLTGPGAGPAELGAALAYLPRRLVVGYALGTGAEQLTELTPAEAAGRSWPSPTVVLVLGADLLAPAPRWLAGLPPGPAGWALPEDEFQHRDSMITKAEVRALALARLGPRVGDLVWDVGAGSGAVAVECARFGAAVIAVERDPAAVPAIHANAARHGVAVQVVAGTAPDCLAALPEPEAVFVGGGGLPVLRAGAARRPARLVACFASVERVGPALSILDGSGYRAGAVQVQANRLARLPDGTHRLAATNPVHLVSGELP